MCAGALLNWVIADDSGGHFVSSSAPSSHLPLLPPSPPPTQNLPPTLFDMPVLQMLDLSRNHIIELPQAVGRCGSLRVLCLRDNELTAVPDEVGLLKELQVLDLSGNR